MNTVLAIKQNLLAVIFLFVLSVKAIFGTILSEEANENVYSIKLQNESNFYLIYLA